MAASTEKETEVVLRRLLVRSIMAKNGKAGAVAGATTAALLLDNIAAEPENEKFTKVRLRNKRIARDIVGCVGAVEFLVTAGFVRKTVEFEECLVWAGSPETAAMGADIIRTRLAKMEEDAARQAAADAAAKGADAARLAEIRTAIAADATERRVRAAMRNPSPSS